MPKKSYERPLRPKPCVSPPSNGGRSQTTSTQTSNVGLILPLQSEKPVVVQSFIILPTSALHNSNSGSTNRPSSLTSIQESTPLIQNSYNGAMPSSQPVTWAHQRTSKKPAILRTRRFKSLITDRLSPTLLKMASLLTEASGTEDICTNLPENRAINYEKHLALPDSRAPISLPQAQFDPFHIKSNFQLENEAVLLSHSSIPFDLSKISSSRLLVCVPETLSLVVETAAQCCPSFMSEIRTVSYTLVQPNMDCKYGPSDISLTSPPSLYRPLLMPSTRSSPKKTAFLPTDPVWNTPFPVMHTHFLKLSSILPRLCEMRKDLDDLPRPSIRLLSRIGRSLVADRYRKQMPCKHLRGVKRLPESEETHQEEMHYLEQTLPPANVAMATTRWRPMALSSTHTNICAKVGCPYRADSLLSLDRHLQLGHYSLQQLRRLATKSPANTRLLSSLLVYPVNPAITKPPSASASSNCYTCKECNFFFTSARAIQNHASKVHGTTHFNAGETCLTSPCAACGDIVDRGYSRLPVCQIKLRGGGKPAAVWRAIRQLLHADPARALSGHVLSALLLLPDLDTPICFPSSLASAVFKSTCNINWDSRLERYVNAISAVRGVLISTGLPRYRRHLEGCINLQSIVGLDNSLVTSPANSQPKSVYCSLPVNVTETTQGMTENGVEKPQLVVSPNELFQRTHPVMRLENRFFTAPLPVSSARCPGVLLHSLRDRSWPQEQQQMRPGVNQVIMPPKRRRVDVSAHRPTFRPIVPLLSPPARQSGSSFPPIETQLPATRPLQQGKANFQNRVSGHQSTPKNTRQKLPIPSAQSHRLRWMLCGSMEPPVEITNLSPTTVWNQLPLSTNATKSSHLRALPNNRLSLSQPKHHDQVRVCRRPLMPEAGAYRPSWSLHGRAPQLLAPASSGLRLPSGGCRLLSPVQRNQVRVVADSHHQAIEMVRFLRHPSTVPSDGGGQLLPPLRVFSRPTSTRRSVDTTATSASTSLPAVSPINNCDGVSSASIGADDMMCPMCSFSSKDRNAIMQHVIDCH